MIANLNIMRKQTPLVIIAMLFFAGISSLAEPFEVPPMGHKEEGTIVTTYKEGGIRWKADWISERYVENGEPEFKLVFKAKGLTSPFSEDMTWEYISVWKAEEDFTPLESETRIKDMSGKLVRIDKKNFDQAKGTAVFEREDLSDSGSIKKQYDITTGTLILEGMVYALRSLPFSTQGSIKAQLLTNEPELYKVEFKQKGIEKIKTDDGEIECYKVELVPKLGLLGVFKVFFPKTYFWFTVAPPHRWVRYEGLENGLGTPEVIMDVVKYKEISN